MTLDEARRFIGAGVVYKPHHGPPEDGIITGVNDYFVFVRYKGDNGAKATYAKDLTLLRPESWPTEDTHG